MMQSIARSAAVDTKDRHILAHVLLPVASLEDAAVTCQAVLPSIEAASGSITAVHVIDTASSWHDMDPEEYRRQIGNDALDLVARRARARGISVETEIICGKEITPAILEMAADVDPSAIVFTPRDSGPWRSCFPTGVIWTLMRQPARPVVLFPAA